MLFVSKHVQSPSEYRRSMAVVSGVVVCVDARTRHDPYKRHLQQNMLILLASSFIIGKKIGKNSIAFTSISSDDQAIESGCVTAR